MLSESDLTAIYKKANGEDTGKPQPLTTQRIFKAMRAIESLTCAERDARIAKKQARIDQLIQEVAAGADVEAKQRARITELERQLEEERKGAERWAYVANHWSNAQFHWNRDQTFKSVVLTIQASHQGSASAPAALAKEIDAAIKEQT